MRRETALTRPWRSSGTICRCDTIVPAFPRIWGGQGGREAGGCLRLLGVTLLPDQEARPLVCRHPSKQGVLPISTSRRSPQRTEKRGRCTLILQLGHHAVLSLLISFQRVCFENLRRRPHPFRNTNLAPSFLRALPHVFLGPLPGSI